MLNIAMLDPIARHEKEGKAGCRDPMRSPFLKPGS
jgi:hypothetical protein